MKSCILLITSMLLVVNFYPGFSQVSRQNQNRNQNQNQRKPLNNNKSTNNNNSQKGNGNDAIDGTLDFAREMIKEEEPMKVGDKGEVKPCKYCNITGVHTVFRSGDVTCIEEGEFKMVDVSLGVKVVNASCFKCTALLIMSGNAEGQLKGLTMRAKLALHEYEESKNQVREVKVVNKGKFRFLFKGAGLLSKLLGILVNLLGGLIGSIIQQEVQKALPRILRENKEQMNLLFMGC